MLIAVKNIVLFIIIVGTLLFSIGGGWPWLGPLLAALAFGSVDDVIIIIIIVIIIKRRLISRRNMPGDITRARYTN